MASSFAQTFLLCTLICVTVTLIPLEATDSPSHLPTYPDSPRLSYAQQLSSLGASLAARKIVTSMDAATESKDFAKLSDSILRLASEGSVKGSWVSHALQGLLNTSSAQSLVDAITREGVSGFLVEVLKGGLLKKSGASDRCINDTGYLLVNMLQGEGWALGFLDATGKIGPGLGEYRLNFVGDYTYCRSLVAPPSREPGNSSPGFNGSYNNLMVALGALPDPANPMAAAVVQLGACMPSSCSETEDTLFLSEAVQYLGINSSNLTLYVLQAEEHTDERHVTTATVLAIIIICIIGCLMVVGTLYDVLILQWPRWRKEWAEKQASSINSDSAEIESSGLLPDGVSADDPLLGKEESVGVTDLPPGTLGQVLVAFSVYSNGSKVLNTSQPPGAIQCINGIRFLSLTWVILGHTFAFCLADIDNLPTAVPDLLNSWSFDAIGNALVSVDTFFTLGGVLVSYLTVREMKKKSWKLNWGLFYFHRYWRLTPPYMLVLVIALGLHQYCGQGPLWDKIQPPDRDACEENWWTNLLYINNIVHSDHTCLAHTWYLANDMQFYLVAPLMIIPFYFHSALGFASCGLFLLVTWITTGTLSTIREWPASILSPKAGSFMSDYFLDYYVVPWCRIGPYVVGIMTGYVLANWRNKIKLSWPKAIIGWIVATAVALAIVYGLRGDISGEHLSSNSVAAFYNAVARSAWAACVCWVIVACVTGWGGFVNVLLSWSPFVVLGRLTYMAYLIHLNMIYIFFENQQTLYHLTDLNIAVVFMGLLVAVYSLAFVFMLALESPMIGLEKIFLPKRRRN